VNVSKTAVARTGFVLIEDVSESAVAATGFIVEDQYLIKCSKLNF